MDSWIPTPERLNALCDAALQVEAAEKSVEYWREQTSNANKQAEAMENDMMFARCQVEAMREAIRRAVEDFEKISVRARISSANPSLYELENLLDVIAEFATKRGSDLEQALNERKET
jgi:predicted sugar kinase